MTVPPGSKLGLVLEERPDGLFVIVDVQKTCPFHSLAKRGDFISLVDGKAPADFVDFTRNQERRRTLTIAPAEHPPHQTIEVTVPPGSKLGLVLEERPDGLFVIVDVQKTCPFHSLAKRGDFISLVDGKAPTDFVDFTRNQERQRTLTIEQQRTLTIAPEEHPPHKTAGTSDPPRKKRRLRSHASCTHGKQVILLQEVLLLPNVPPAKCTGCGDLKEKGAYSSSEWIKVDLLCEACEENSEKRCIGCDGMKKKGAYSRRQWQKVNSRCEACEENAEKKCIGCDGMKKKGAYYFKEWRNLNSRCIACLGE